MSIFEKRIKPEATENKIPLTKEPTIEDLSIWYGLTTRGFRKRRQTQKISIKNRILTEGDLGEIFFKCGLPPKLPADLHDWAESLCAAWCRLVPFKTV